MDKKIKVNEFFPQIPGWAEKFQIKHGNEEHTAEEWKDLFKKFINDQ